MYTELLQEFERVLRKANPSKADRLLPGLPRSKVQKMLNKNGIQGCVEPILGLFSWRNGTRGEAYITEEEVSIIPFSKFFLPRLDLMIADFCSFPEIVRYQSRYRELVGRYFPILWDGSVNYISIDLESQSVGRVAIIERDAPALVREAYPSFTEFVSDVVVATQNNRRLSCFQ